MKNLLSDATKRNWEKLGVKEDFQKRLSKRANKKYSVKKILPVEYLSDSRNIDILERILKFSEKYSVKTIVYNISLNYLIKYSLVKIVNNEIFTNNKYLKEILNNFNSKVYQEILDLQLPLEEKDFIGCVYQAMISEGYKNINGSYYTPQEILDNIEISPQGKFLDPCCGTGSFLLHAAKFIKDPLKIYGCDIDKTACFIAKINLILTFKNKIFNPQIYNTDFLTDKKTLKNMKFETIATNPPWGAAKSEKYTKLFPQIKSGESYSYFVYLSKMYLENIGSCTFVLPKSILNISAHKDIREFIINNYYINKIKNFGQIFNGVLTDTILLSCGNTPPKNDNIILTKNSQNKTVKQDCFRENYNYNFSFMSNNEFKILNKIFKTEHYTLENSIWALGIVTGDNKKHILQAPENNAEIIYTGKEIKKYILDKPSKYIKYNRNNYQQIAPEEFYRAKEKLLYKFISKKLIFAYDNSASLVLNSANILIPKIPDYSTKTVMAFLNSKLFEFVYKIIFDDIKILKGNLSILPFPKKIPFEIMEKTDKLVDLYIQNQDDEILNRIDNIVYQCFNLTNNEIAKIEEEITNEK